MSRPATATQRVAGQIDRSAPSGRTAAHPARGGSRQARTASASVCAVKWPAIRAAFPRCSHAACASFRSIRRLWRKSSTGDRRTELAGTSVSEAATRRKPAKSVRLREYKRIFKQVLDNRPSGMRLAARARDGQEPQLRQPNYRIRPIRFRIPVSTSTRSSRSAISRRATKAAFLEAYARAHPRRMGRAATKFRASARSSLHLPDLGKFQAQRTARRAVAGVRAPADRTSCRTRNSVGRCGAQ